MKKLDQLFTWEHPTLEGRIEEIHKKVVPLIKLVNSQQEAIEKLESKVWTADFIEKYRPALENLADDTHRTVTLRIPKEKTLGEALWDAFDQENQNPDISMGEWLLDRPDTDLQKALDEVQPNE